MTRIGTIDARAIVQQEIERLNKTEADLAISKGILVTRDEMAPPNAAKQVAAPARADAMTAQWQAFTTALGKYAEQAEADAKMLGGSEGVRRQLTQVSEARDALAGILQPTPRMPVFKSEVQEAVDVVGRHQYLKRDVISPKALEAIDVLVAPYAARLDGAAFEGIFKKGAPLSTLLVDPPAPLPAIGKKNLPEYLRELAKQLESGKLVLEKDERSLSMPSAAGFAAKLRKAADAYDPTYRPGFGQDKPSRSFDGLGHLTIGLASNDPIAKWGRMMDWAEIVEGQNRR
jgi:hypothetical protein